MEEKFQQLKEKIAQIEHISGAMSVMSWDQETYMPDGAAETRADQQATIGGLIHQMSTSEELGQMLQDLLPYAEQLDYDSDTASIIRVTWREYQKSVRIPTPLMMEFYATSSLSRQAWKKAREEDNFAAFQPHLEKMLDVQLRMAEHLKTVDVDNLYDVLIDYFEPGLTSAQIERVFSGVKPDLVELIRQISEAEQVDQGMMYGPFDQESQLAFSKFVAEKLGYDFNRGRLDLVAHPFTIANSYRDVRITTRIDKNYVLSNLFSVIHEAGHAIHFQKGSPSLYASGITGAGLSICESQSRFYENVLGRSMPFWTYFFPKIREYFPIFKEYDLPAFYRAVNKVAPSLIRVEADEVTYGMHIMLRFELENAVINGKVSVADLPEIWNARMEEYLGVTPPDNAQGVLQDVHWSQMPMGYFPTYLLGSMFSSQLWHYLQKDNPAVESQVEAGDFSQINSWMTAKIQVHGGKFTLPEFTQRATGEALNSNYYMDYLRAKYGEIYHL